MTNKTYIYKRFSTKKQDDQQQNESVQRYIKMHGIDVDNADVVTEQESGAVSYIHRELNGLLERLQLGDTLIVSEMSRLGRDTIDGAELLGKFIKIGIILIDCKRHCVYDCSKLSARDKEYIIRDFNRAEEEREFLQYRVNNGVGKAKKDGILFGRSNPKYGADDPNGCAARLLQGKIQGAINKNKNVIESEKTLKIAKVLRTVVPEYAANLSPEPLFFLCWGDMNISLTLEQRHKMLEVINTHYPELAIRKVKGVEVAVEVKLNITDAYNFHSNLIQSIRKYNANLKNQ